MRLIDANEILKIAHNVKELDDALDPITEELIEMIIDVQPTSKAIPIEWINTWLNTGRNAKYFIPMMEMIEEWEKENEK